MLLLKPHQRVFAVAVIASGCAIVACQVVAGIERVDKVPQGSVIDGSSGSSGVGEDALSNYDAAADPCKHVLPAPPPEKDDDPETNLPPFYLALRQVSLTEKNAAGDPTGFDLDNVCTCDTREGSRNKGVSSCKPKKKDCDFDGGVDNIGQTLFTTFAPANFSIDGDANNSINEGRRGLLMYITKYNGKPNDKLVEVGAMITNGIEDGTGCQGNVANHTPGWCGKDLWTYPQNYVRVGSKEPVGVAVGYVSNGELVFRSDAEIKMFFAGAVLAFGSPITAGTLEKNAQGNWKLTGKLTGRIPVNELLAATGHFPAPPPDPTIGLCNSTYWATVKGLLCGSVDIKASNVFDFQDTVCDAVSTSIGFTAEQAEVGEEKSEPVDDNPCAADKVSPQTYVCP